VLLKSNREAQHAVDQARDARARVRDDAVRNPADILSDDGFRRND
jgi:hypothetical protein